MNSIWVIKLRKSIGWNKLNFVKKGGVNKFWLLSINVLLDRSNKHLKQKESKMVFKDNDSNWSRELEATKKVEK